MDKPHDVAVFQTKDQEAEQTTQSVKCRLPKFKDPSSDPQHPRGKLGTGMGGWNPSTGEEELGRLLEEPQLQ